MYADSTSLQQPPHRMLLQTTQRIDAGGLGVEEVGDPPLFIKRRNLHANLSEVLRIDSWRPDQCATCITDPTQAGGHLAHEVSRTK
jgi:hypothetical protein